MSTPEYKPDSSLGRVPCETDRQSWSCPNMKDVEGDLDMSFEHYECEMCGRRISLDYEEMK